LTQTHWPFCSSTPKAIRPEELSRSSGLSYFAVSIFREKRISDGKDSDSGWSGNSRAAISVATGGLGAFPIGAWGADIISGSLMFGLILGKNAI
jgi:hypothetical protein